ncbi:MAG TPA: prephenate dehydrogenase [bacterium]|nr:prephenate dehydrogenase [bacterium]HPR88558.1 prephenate dehydrogenase [bacterium]
MDENPSFKRVVIIGVGLIGGSLALALKRKGFKGLLIGVDRPEVLEVARQRQAIDESYSPEEIAAALDGADLVFLCTPISGILGHLRTIGPYIQPGTLITDVGSTKRKIVETAAIHLPSQCDFIGGHPMAGSEFKGIEAADAFLFENTTWVLTPAKPMQEERRKAIGDLVEMTGALVLLISPHLHDEIAAAVSHLPQMAAIALMSLAARRQSESSHFLKMAAGGFRDMTRIASSPFGIWEDILATNDDMIVTYIDAFIEELKHVRAALEHNEMRTIFDQSARNRLSIPRDTRGFFRPHFDILVAVQDRPGMLAIIANALVEKQINIKDIEILKIRENEGGTMRLAFASESDRQMALELLRSRDLECRKRD